MELFVKSLKGPCQLTGIQPSLTIQELKDLLQNQYKRAGHDLPGPDNQRLIYKDNLLTTGTLQDAGVGSGDSLVLLFFKEHTPRSEPEPAPVPDAAAISAAIREEAKKQGIETQLTEEVPPRRPTSSLTSTMEDMDQRLIQLVEALEGRLTLARNRERPGAGAAAPAPEEPLQVPEPSSESVAQLVDMGFSEPLARKALLMTAGNLEAALEWVLQHGDDPDASEPPTQEQLRAVYGNRRSAARRGQHVLQLSQEDMLETLVEMGFEAREAAAALARFGSLESALPALLHMQAQRPAAEAGQAGASGAAGDRDMQRQEGDEGAAQETESRDEEEDEEEDEDEDAYFEEQEHEDEYHDAGQGLDEGDEDMEEIETEDDIIVEAMPSFMSNEMEQILEGMMQPQQMMMPEGPNDLLLDLMDHQASRQEAAAAGDRPGRESTSAPGADQQQQQPPPPVDSSRHSQ